MQELSMDELNEVGGGQALLFRIFKGWLVDYTVGAILDGKVGYTEAVEASGSGYCMLGA